MQMIRLQRTKQWQREWPRHCKTRSKNSNKHFAMLTMWRSPGLRSTKTRSKSQMITSSMSSYWATNRLCIWVPSRRRTMRYSWRTRNTRNWWAYTLKQRPACMRQGRGRRGQSRWWYRFSRLSCSWGSSSKSREQSFAKMLWPFTLLATWNPCDRKWKRRTRSHSQLLPKRNFRTVRRG